MHSVTAVHKLGCALRTAGALKVSWGPSCLRRRPAAAAQQQAGNRLHGTPAAAGHQPLPWAAWLRLRDGVCARRCRSHSCVCRSLKVLFAHGYAQAAGNRVSSYLHHTPSPASRQACSSGEGQAAAAAGAVVEPAQAAHAAAGALQAAARPLQAGGRSGQRAREDAPAAQRGAFDKGEHALMGLVGCRPTSERNSLQVEGN